MSLRCLCSAHFYLSKTIFRILFFQEATQEQIDIVLKQLEKPPTISYLTDGCIKRYIGSKAYGMFKCLKNDYNCDTIYLNSKVCSSYILFCFRHFQITLLSDN